MYTNPPGMNAYIGTHAGQRHTNIHQHNYTYIYNYRWSHTYIHHACHTKCHLHRRSRHSDESTGSTHNPSQQCKKQNVDHSVAQWLPYLEPSLGACVHHQRQGTCVYRYRHMMYTHTHSHSRALTLSLIYTGRIRYPIPAIAWHNADLSIANGIRSVAA